MEGRCWSNESKIFADLCQLVEVVKSQGTTSGAKEAHPHIFTTYTIEDDLLNGKVHYTSMDGTQAIAYNNDERIWCIQPVGSRYWIALKYSRIALYINSVQGDNKHLGINERWLKAPGPNRPYLEVLWQQRLEGCRRGPGGEMCRSQCFRSVYKNHNN